jgi:large subunit ribosomal protein L18
MSKAQTRIVRRTGRVRGQIKRAAGERKRLTVFRSSKHIYAQVIDGKKTGANKDAAKAVGKLLAERATEKGVKEVVFDRGGYLYHGRVKALADAAREGGLKF